MADPASQEEANPYRSPSTQASAESAMPPRRNRSLWPQLAAGVAGGLAFFAVFMPVGLLAVPSLGDRAGMIAAIAVAMVATWWTRYFVERSLSP